MKCAHCSLIAADNVDGGGGLLVLATRRRQQRLRPRFENLQVEPLARTRPMLQRQLADLTSFQLNSRMESGKVKLDPETRRLLAAYLKHDYLLYNHFKQRFSRATQF